MFKEACIDDFFVNNETIIDSKGQLGNIHKKLFFLHFQKH